MDNNQLHYLMRIKQEDIKKMILETLPTFKASRDSKKKASLLLTGFAKSEMTARKCVKPRLEV